MHELSEIWWEVDRLNKVLMKAKMPRRETVLRRTFKLINISYYFFIIITTQFSRFLPLCDLTEISLQFGTAANVSLCFTRCKKPTKFYGCCHYFMCSQCNPSHLALS